MSRSLRDALHSAAAAAGCSLNVYALQILAAAAGDASRFRSATPDPANSVHDLARDERGFPLKPKARDLHITARCAYIDAVMAESGPGVVDRLVREHDLEDPAFYVEWYRSRGA